MCPNPPLALSRNPNPNPHPPHQERQFHAAFGKHKELDEIAEIVKTKSLGAVVRYFYLVEGARPREERERERESARARERESVELGGGVHRARPACSRCNGLRDPGQKKKQQREKKREIESLKKERSRNKAEAGAEDDAPTPRSHAPSPSPRSHAPSPAPGDPMDVD